MPWTWVVKTVRIVGQGGRGGNRVRRKVSERGQRRSGLAVFRAEDRDVSGDSGGETTDNGVLMDAAAIGNGPGGNGGAALVIGQASSNIFEQLGEGKLSDKFLPGSRDLGGGDELATTTIGLEEEDREEEVVEVLDSCGGGGGGSDSADVEFETEEQNGAFGELIDGDGEAKGGEVQSLQDSRSEGSDFEKVVLALSEGKEKKVQRQRENRQRQRELAKARKQAEIQQREAELTRAGEDEELLDRAVAQSLAEREALRKAEEENKEGEEWARSVQEQMSKMLKTAKLMTAELQGERAEREGLERRVAELRRGMAAVAEPTVAVEGLEDERDGWTVVRRGRSGGARGRGRGGAGRGSGQGVLMAYQQGGAGGGGSSMSLKTGCQRCCILWHPNQQRCALGGCHVCDKGPGGKGVCDARTGERYFVTRMKQLGVAGPWKFEWR
jgi:hypothetical protein